MADYKAFQVFYPHGKDKTPEQVKRTVDRFLDGPDQEAVLQFGMLLIGIKESDQARVMKRWEEAGKPKIRPFIPYFTHILSIELFFKLAIACDIVARTRASHKIDLAYLYYLPFCMVFSSEDRLHSLIVPHFLRKNQTFVKGSELKADLRALDAHYSGLPPEEIAKGVEMFASYPPRQGDFLVTRLWDAHMAPEWRRSAERPPFDPESPSSQKLRDMLRSMRQQAEPGRGHLQPSEDELHYMEIQRLVHAQKGKWRIMPPEVKS